MSLEYYDDSYDSDNNFPHYARITFFGQLPYTMTKERIIIGRNSAAGLVDIDVGSVSFVSRKHLELTYSYQKLKVKCLGKNGIFIDNAFKSHSCIPYELPIKCTLRFPSTDVQFCVEQVIGIKSPAKVRTYGKAKSYNRFYDQDDSPDHKRIKLQSRVESEISEHENNDSYQGFREVICNFSDNDVEDYIHNDDTVRKLSVSDCDGLMNEASEENDGVLIDNLGNYTLDNNVAITNLPKEYTLENIKSNEINSTSMLRGIDQQNSSRAMTKFVFSNVRYSNDSYVPNGNRITVLDQDDLTIEHGSDTQKPPYSYAQLIVQAVSTARDRQLTLNGIYNYISKNYPYFKAHDKGWQNSVRHNLSLNRYFIKVPRGQDEPGKGSFWRVDPTYESKLISQAFRKRRLRNNTSGIISENALVSQVLNVSSIEPNNQSSNSKVFGMNKSAHLVNRTANLSNVITLKRTCDINNHNGSTTYMLSNPSSLSSHGDIQKYILTNRNNNNAALDTLQKSSTILKCQPNKPVIIDGGNLKLSSNALSSSLHNKSNNNTNNLNHHNDSIIQTSNQVSNSGRTLISLGGRLYSTTSIKSLQVQQQQQQNHQLLSPSSRIISTSSTNIINSNGLSKLSNNNSSTHNNSRNHNNLSAFDTSALTDSSDGTSMSNIINNKTHTITVNNHIQANNISINNNHSNSYYLISPNNYKNHKSLSSNTNDNHQSSPITISSSNNTANRRIINIQSQSPNIRKIDLSNGSHTDNHLKSPIILKKVKIHNNFVTVKADNNISSKHGLVSLVKSSLSNTVDNGTVENDSNLMLPTRLLVAPGGSSLQYVGSNLNNQRRSNQVDDDDDEDGVGTSVHQDETTVVEDVDSQVFMSDNDHHCDMEDHFLISHSDPSVVNSTMPTLPPLPTVDHRRTNHNQHSHSVGSSPVLYKHHNSDEYEDEDDATGGSGVQSHHNHVEDDEDDDEEDDEDDMWQVARSDEHNDADDEIDDVTSSLRRSDTNNVCKLEPLKYMVE